MMDVVAELWSWERELQRGMKKFMVQLVSVLESNDERSLIEVSRVRI